jgi:phage terminase large subunit-like protein
MNLSNLTREQQNAFFASLTDAELYALQYDWSVWGRAGQQLPQGAWFVWLILAGRGWGKTRTAVENIAQMLRGPSPMIAPAGSPKYLTIVADSPKDLREYSIDGPSGFLSVGPAEYRPLYEPSKSTLTWANGAKAVLYSAEDPEALRGASGSFFWWDELAKSRYAESGWENLMYGMRESNPRGIVTTTPRPLKLLKDLMARPSTVITRGSTMDNRANLAETYFKNVIEPRLGTRQGRQEIDGEILEDIDSALWDRQFFDNHRIKFAPYMKRIVVAVDPSGGKDAIGIVAAGEGGDGRAYVLADKTLTGNGNTSPATWGKCVTDTYTEFSADCIVAERNFGGDMVEHVIRTASPHVPVKMVTASRGKVVRAEPVAALYEQGKVSHVGSMHELEDQCCMMNTNGYNGDGSPDRVDALVWALTELMLKEPVVPKRHIHGRMPSLGPPQQSYPD